MALTGAGGTADAVTAGTAAQQDDDIAGGGTLAADIVSRSGSNHSAALQTLGHVAVVVQLGDVAGSQADLVAVGRIACGSGLAQLTLGQLAGDGLAEGLPGVACAGDAHGLVDVGTAGQGVTDTAADTGGCAAEGLDFGGMVVGLVLEHQQPVLLLAVDGGCDMDGAGIDLFALVQLGEHSPLLQRLSADGGNVHQGLGTLCSLLFAIDLHTGSQVPLVSGLHGFVMDLDVIQVGGEGGMAAMVGPVGVHHADFGDGGVTVLFAGEVVLQELQIVQVHSQAQGVQQFSQSLLVHGNEAFHGGNGLGCGILGFQGLGLFQGSFPAFHSVDDVLLDGGHVLLGQVAVEGIDLGGLDGGTVALGQDLDALGGGVSPLVELTGQGFHGEDNSAGQLQLGSCVIQLGLGEDSLHGIAEELLGDVFCVVTVEQADLFNAFDAQQVLGLAQQGPGLVLEAFLLFYKYAINHGVISS